MASLYHKAALFGVAFGLGLGQNPTVVGIRIEFMDAKRHSVFVTGGTGYLGRPLAAVLLERGHEVRALVRAGSEEKLPTGCQAVIGNALEGSSYADKIRPADTFVQLVGVAHPNPSKAAEFRSVDLASARGAVLAALKSGVQHMVYVSVAHPAPMMKAYIEVRSECESMIRESGMNATILRPWYVLGPGHRWPYALIPMYWLMECLPKTRDGALRLGLVTREQMIRALVNAVENPCRGIRIVEVPEIRSASGFAMSARAACL
ncbi:MAG: NAD(P)H-binding protein [Terriglobales bacterium]